MLNPAVDLPTFFVDRNGTITFQNKTKEISLEMAVIQFTSPSTSLIFPKLKPKSINCSLHHLLSSKSQFNFRISAKLYSFQPSNQTKKPPFNPQPISLPCLQSIKPYITSQWKSIAKGWLCSVISVCCLSKVVPKVGKFSSVLSKPNGDRLVEQGLVLGFLLLVQLTANYWQQAFLWEAALNSAYNIRVYVFDKLLQRDLEFFEGASAASSGDIAYRITAEASDVADTVYALLNSILPSMLQLIAMATQMVLLSPVLTLLSALVIPCISLVIAHLGEKLRKISKKAHLSVAKLSEYLNEVLPSLLFIKANSAELCECTRFKRLAHADMVEHLRKKRMKALIPQIVQAIYVGVLLLLCFGSLVLLRSFFDGSSTVSFLTSLFLLVEPIQGIGKAYNELKQGEPAIERLFDLTMFSPTVIEMPDVLDLDSVTGDLKFCDISFRYGDTMPLVLSKFNLHVKPGETIALVGPSGGGKTTITKLLLRLYDPFCGCILIDDCDIQRISLKSLRRHVGLVSQDITLFAGSVAENIGYRDLMSNINLERVENAAKTANADEFINKLSKGYDTNIGPRGSLLSGGQKQRLAIARAVYQNSSILILDEATSALDSKSEMLVREAVERLMKNRTVLVIAHRLETVLMADRIVVLENGNVKEVNRSSLLNKGSQYSSEVPEGIVI